MSLTRSPSWCGWLVAVAGALAITSCAATDVVAQESVQIVVPPIVSFNVTDVGGSTPGTPSPTTIAFTNASLDASHGLRISVKADSNITGAGGSIAASKVSWTVSNVSHGVASNGVLSATQYTTVFDGQAGVISGGLDLVWTLSAPGNGLHAGNYQVVLRWKLEALPQ